MDEVVLKCAVYGEATVFPVKIARDAKVSELQEAIVANLSAQQPSAPTRTVTLSLAYKNGAWLKDAESVPTFVRGEIDQQYQKALPSWKLTNEKLFGSQFELGEDQIHILVEVSPQVQPRTTRKMARESEGRPGGQPPRKKKRKENSHDNDSWGDATWAEGVQRMEVGNEKDPGIAIGWADDDTLHACLGVPGAPVPQGANAAASGAALRDWFSGLVVAANPNLPVTLRGGGRSSEFFDHLMLDKYGDIVEELLVTPIIAWWAPLHAAGLSARQFYMVTDRGRGRNDALHQSFMPFLS